jgi:hypothetical protein
VRPFNCAPRPEYVAHISQARSSQERSSQERSSQERSSQERSSQERSSQERSLASAAPPAPLAGKFNQIGRRPLYRTYEDGRTPLSNSYAPTRTLALRTEDLRTMEDLGCFKSSHTFLSSRLRRRMRLWRMPGGAQRRIKRAAIGPKRTICAVPVRNGGRNTLKSPQGATLGQFDE